ncbi:MAG TPA: alpha/beta hydrolase, partial [Dehalococcoidia bacterium]|nr:alpha/beta hydrolase [Dehalococcoidia bacterium]
METVASRDGTRIAFEKCGNGPPLVLVHGSSSDGETAWRFAVPTLERYFTIYPMDRRGRGDSGDGPRYSIERELDDVMAVIDAAGEPVNLVGHGFGGVLSLEASRLTPNVRKLVLYEAGITTPRGAIYPDGAVERMEEMLAQDNRDGVVITLMRDIIKLSADDIGMIRAQPRFLERLKNAHTIPRELHAHRDYHFDPARFAGFQVPTLILVGERS